MYCKNCGYEVIDCNFCPNCGTKIEPIKTIVVEEQTSKTEVEIEESQPIVDDVLENVIEKHERRKQKAYSALAKVGFGLGIGTFAASFMIPGMLFLGIGAFILCNFGKKSLTANSKAKIGFGLSLAGMIINTFVTIILI